MNKLLVSSLAALMLIGCGGGNSSTSTSNSGSSTGTGTGTGTNEIVKGYFAGQTSQNDFIDIVAKGNGEFWGIYSSGGFVQGNLSVSGDKVTSNNAKDFFFTGASVSAATISATAKTNTNLNGTLKYTGISNSIDFNTTYQDSLKVYSLPQLAGTYKGDVSIIQGGEQAIVTVNSNGTIMGKGSSGCLISGTVKLPSDNSQYYYDIEFKFSGTPCYMENQTLRGIGFYDGGAFSVQAVNTDRTNGVNFSGWKQ